MLGFAFVLGLGCSKRIRDCAVLRLPQACPLAACWRQSRTAPKGNPEEVHGGVAGSAFSGGAFKGGGAFPCRRGGGGGGGGGGCGGAAAAAKDLKTEPITDD